MAEASTYSNILTKGYRASLDDLELDEGKLRFTEDTGELFLDLDDKRIQISRDVETSKTESQILASTSAFEKIYLSSDTHRLYYPEIGESTITWNCVGEENASSVDYATNAGTADYATNAGTATYATNAGTATNASSSNYATNAGTATYATNAGTADYATNAGTATNASSADYATNAGTASRASADADGNNFSTVYAPLNSPTFTGNPTAPNQSTADSSQKIANTKFVIDAITAAIGSITGISFSVVASTADFPATGEGGVFYLVPNNTSGDNNIYDEYVWINSTTGYEKIGSTDIDLSGYYNNTTMTGAGNAITSVSASSGTLTFDKGATFLTQHPSISTSSSTAASTATAGGTVNVIDAVTVDDNGHVTSYRINTVTLPDIPSTVAFATNSGTATYAGNAGTAVYATNAATANYSTNSGTATYASNVGTATYATNAGTAAYTTNVGTATYATNAGTAAYAAAVKNGSTFDFGSV